MAESNEVNLAALYTELKKHEINSDYSKAFTVSEKILKIFPDEKEANLCQIVCLIQLSKFKEALLAIDNNREIIEELAFERAYCLYRLNEPKNALDVLTACKTPSLKSQELQAQILYRLERYEECYNLYKEIIKQSHDYYEDERTANLAAVITCLVTSQRESRKELPQIGENTYELLYNAACRLAEEEKFVEAIAKLQASEKLCRTSLEGDDLSAEEIENELAIINTQLAYCKQQLGKEKEAQSIYNAILKRKPKDIAVAAIASNNSVVINGDQNIFDSKKKIRFFNSAELEYKLTSRQKAAIALNQCLFALYNQQVDQCLQLCEKLEKQYPSMSEGAVLVRAVIKAKGQKFEEAIELLKNFASTNVEQQMKTKLTAAHLFLSMGNRKDACEILESLVTIDYKPGIVSALVTLYGGAGDNTKASKLLNDAVNYHITHQDGLVDLKSFWRETANHYLREDSPQNTVKCLHELLKLSPYDNEALAKLVIAYVKFDVKKAMEYYDKLPPIKSDNIDIASLENISWNPNKQKKLKVQPSPGKTPGSADAEKAKKKKKRKVRLPKDYNPNIPPDPERWLPRHERSTYKKRKDRRYRDVGIGKGTQGAAGATSDQYDITKRPITAPAATAQSSQQIPRLQSKSKFQPKRKKKGGR